VFGPVLHVLRFDRARLGELIDAVNATGYALTLGVASRIDGTIAEITERARAGNIYVNRNMIGAVVGVQPFGGRGLSGTGPKAGGPLYLRRLLQRSPDPQWPSNQRGRVPRALRRFISWLRHDQSGLLSEVVRIQLLSESEHYAARGLLEACMRLNGYVGESNELRLRALGVLRVTARSAPALLSQLAAALASGNTVVVDQAALGAAVRSALPSALRARLLEDAPRYQAVLVDGAEAQLNPHWLRELRREIAARDGPIVEVVVGAERYPIERLLMEQTVTINTAAVGGDVELLALKDQSTA
jgi:RHH-type proline utilization regulon transcriptional repressor/proline dehydrogenase/delta 1-pyrroline-5-carboxylate dehydrogenase